MFDTLIHLEIGTGDSKRTFEALKGVLCFYSGYFNAALNGRFREATDYAVTMPTEDPLIFDLFLHWIHTRRFFESTLEPTVLLDYATLAKLWVFGDAHHVPLLQNVVSDILTEKMFNTATAPEAEVIDYIYNNTAEGSQLREDLLDNLRQLGPGCPRCEWNNPWNGDAYHKIDAEVIKRELLSMQLGKPYAGVRHSLLETNKCHRCVHEPGVKCV